MNFEIIAYVVLAFFALLFILRGIDSFVNERISSKLERIIEVLEGENHDQTNQTIPAPRVVRDRSRDNGSAESRRTSR